MADSTTDVAEVPRLKTRYNEQVAAQLKEELGIENVMQIPKLDKIVINMGVGRATQQPSLLEKAVDELTLIAGQKPIVTKAQTSIAGFKLREGQAIGTKVTLRGDRIFPILSATMSFTSGEPERARDSIAAVACGD